MIVDSAYPVIATDLFTVLPPTTVGALTIAPLVRNAPPIFEYVGLAGAIARGARVDEVGEEGDVASIVVHNPLDLPVLLYDGEAVAGAKQDRIINVSVLLPPAHAERIPVSCVEHGRWQRRSARFHSSDHTASPSLRRGKAEALRGDPHQRGRAQTRVWSEVGAMSERVGARSETGALAEVFATLRPHIDDLAGRFALVPGQCGAVVAIGGRPVCIDAVSRADVFAELWPRLLAGYAADAAHGPAGRPVRRRHLVALLGTVGTVPLVASPSVGMGSDIRGATAELEATGLIHDGEVVQLSAYVH